MSFEPSLVTYAVLPSGESAAQCGCLPTAMLRTSLLVSGSNSISLSRSLHHDDAELGAVEQIDEVGRYAGRDLGHDLVGGRIEHLDRRDARFSKIEALAAIPEFAVARRFVERHGPNDTARAKIDHGEAEMARFLRGRVSKLAVRLDRDGMGLRHRYCPDHLV